MSKGSNANKRQLDELRRLAAQPEETIDIAAIPEVRDWTDAERGRFFRPVKQQVTLRIDADLVAWFKAQGNKYQTRMNAALREYVESHRKAG